MDDRKKQPATDKPAKEARKARLKSALRDNLKRRKEAAKNRKGGPDSPQTG